MMAMTDAVYETAESADKRNWLERHYAAILRHGIIVFFMIIAIGGRAAMPATLWDGGYVHP